MQYVSGETIRRLRAERGMTQRALAERLSISDKTVSKWETGRGLPDITLLPELAAALRVSVAELFTGEHAENRNRAANMLRSVFYVCPVCGNVIVSAGRGAFSCCGILLPETEPQAADDAHEIEAETDGGELYVHMAHPMEKAHAVSFLAYVTGGSAEIVKLYPEQDAEARFLRRGHGTLYAFCTRHGLFKKKL
ncbi:MAG: helix-turn-helix domain-containing protein [Hominenteromicrobium sp.]